MSKYLKSKIKILKKLNIKILSYFTSKINIKYHNNIKKNINNKVINLYKINIINYNFFKYIYKISKNKLKKFIIFNYYNLLYLKFKRLDIILFKLGLSKTLFQSFQLIKHKFIFLNFKLIKFSNIICKINDLISINTIKYNIFIIYKFLINLNVNIFIKNKNKFLICFKFMKFKIINL